MANDRMYLRCDTCGAQKLLAKTFGRGWSIWRHTTTRASLLDPAPEYETELENWLEAHGHGRPNEPRFSIKYEVRDNA